MFRVFLFATAAFNVHFFVLSRSRPFRRRAQACGGLAWKHHHTETVPGEFALFHFIFISFLFSFPRDILMFVYRCCCVPFVECGLDGAALSALLEALSGSPSLENLKLSGSFPLVHATFPCSLAPSCRQPAWRCRRVGHREVSPRLPQPHTVGPLRWAYPPSLLRESVFLIQTCRERYRKRGRAEPCGRSCPDVDC